MDVLIFLCAFGYQNTYQALALIFLKEVESVQRVEAKPYCFEIKTKEKDYQIACKSDEELYSWMDEVYQVRTVWLTLPGRMYLLTIGSSDHL